MSRSPLAYPLTRGIDADSGGAADLQTDIMRFMAILALCLVAIFALVQSLPMQPVAPPDPAPLAEPASEVPPPVVETPPKPQPVAAAKPEAEVVEQVSLTRPKWVTTFQPRQAQAPPVAEPVPAEAEAVVVEPEPVAAEPEPQGFTLRFESDLALTRLVASGQVGFYAIGNGRAQRMSVADSRISFWDASTPNAFHEMEAMTVPRPVVEALARTGEDTRGVDWAVTLPGKLSRQLDALMREHSGGSLVIRSNGNLELEAG